MPYSFTADGLELDSVAHWVGVNSNRWAVPGAKGENVSVPARHGSLFVADKTFTENEFALEIQVTGFSDSGFVPASDLAQTQENIDQLLRIFTKRKNLIHLVYTRDDGNKVECYAECTGAFDVSRPSAKLPYAKMVVALKIPSAFWQDQLPSVYVSPLGLTNTQALRMPPFEGGTAPMDDSIILVHGPISSPEIKVVETGAYTRLERNVPVGNTWRINCQDWSSVMGPNVQFDSTNDPSVIGLTVHGGSASLVDIPPLTKYGLAIQIGGTNTGAATQVEVRGRRKYLVS